MTTRRVVTGHDENGRSTVVLDTGPGRITEVPMRNLNVLELWATDASPIPIAITPDDPSGRPMRVQPNPSGTVIRISEFGPDPFSHGAQPDAEAISASFTSMGSANVSNWRPGLHPSMHRSETLDYGIVLEGELDLVLDDSEVHLNTGDLVVQCGTNHAWVNRSDKVCRMLFVLMDGVFEQDLAELLGVDAGER